MTKRLLPLAILTLAACSNGVNAPSLMPRAIEKEANAARPVAPPVAAAPINPDLQRRLGELVGRVKDGNIDFEKVDKASGRAIATGLRSAEGSEAWVEAQQSQSAMEAARQASASALAEIETLLLAQTEAAANDPKVGGIAELTAAEQEASAIVARQTARLQELTR